MEVNFDNFKKLQMKIQPPPKLILDKFHHVHQCAHGYHHDLPCDLDGERRRFGNPYTLILSDFHYNVAIYRIVIKKVPSTLLVYYCYQVA